MIFNENSQHTESQTMTEKEAFKIVYKKMTSNDAPPFFKGKYDAKKMVVMYLCTVFV